MRVQRPVQLNTGAPDACHEICGGAESFALVLPMMCLNITTKQHSSGRPYSAFDDRHRFAVLEASDDKAEGGPEYKMREGNSRDESRILAGFSLFHLLISHCQTRYSICRMTSTV